MDPVVLQAHLESRMNFATASTGARCSPRAWSWRRPACRAMAPTTSDVTATSTARWHACRSSTRARRAIRESARRIEPACTRRPSRRGMPLRRSAPIATPHITLPIPPAIAGSWRSCASAGPAMKPRFARTATRSMERSATSDTHVWPSVPTVTAHMRFLPASNPASTISPGKRLQTCQTATRAPRNASRSTIRMPTQRREAEPGSVHVGRLMHALLGGVFLFFGVHTILWLPRSWRLRRERRDAVRRLRNRSETDGGKTP